MDANLSPAQTDALRTLVLLGLPIFDKRVGQALERRGLAEQGPDGGGFYLATVDGVTAYRQLRIAEGTHPLEATTMGVRALLAAQGRESARKLREMAASRMDVFVALLDNDPHRIIRTINDVEKAAGPDARMCHDGRPAFRYFQALRDEAYRRFPALVKG